MPNVDAGPDQYICEGDSIQLNGSGAWIYEWTPSTNLSNPFISNPIAYPNSTTTYYLIGKSLGDNVIINGDFENGNVDFTSEYSYDCYTTFLPEGYYCITNNPHNSHTGFATCNDHTPDPADQMMVINGSYNPGKKIWCQNVSVTPYTEYAFSTWLTSVHPIAPAELQFSINDVLLGSSFTADTNTCNWIQFYETWNSGSNTTAEICIVNQTLVYVGNDFAIDDIYFAPLCESIDSVTVFVNPLPEVEIVASSNVICDGQHTQLTASSDIPGTTYQWNNGETTAMIDVSPTFTTTYSVTGTTQDGCTGTASVTVTVHPLPTIIDSATPSEICLNESSELIVSSDIPGTTFSWSNGLGTNPSVTVSPTSATTYSVTGTTIEGCTGTAEVTVTVHPLPNITATATPTEICLGESSNLMVSSDIPGTTFNWSNGLGTNSNLTVSPTTTATYSVTGITPEGCTSTAEITVTVHPLPNITATATPTEICLGESSNLMVSSDIPGTTFNWSNGLGTNSNVTVSPTTTTTYSVTGITPEGCTSTAEITVTVHPLPNINFSVNPAHCGQSDGSISLNIYGAVPPFTFIWSNGYTDANLNNIVAGNYIVTVTDAIGCINIATIYVEDLPGPTANFTFKPQMTTIENPIIYFQNYSIGATSYYWTFGDGNSSEEFAPNHVYSEPGSYHVVLYAIDDYNCIDTVGAQIIIKDISTFYIPNAIMPHRGDINSIFNVFGVNIDPNNFEMRIFNRWGNQIFYTTNPNRGWDGTYNGEYVQEGSYSYIFNFITETDGIKHTVIGKVLVLY